MSNWLSHASFLGHLGKYGQKISDPLAWIGGNKWTHLTSDVLPGKVNEGLSHVMKPFEYVDKHINPVRRIPIVDRIGNIVASKPGDAAAIAAGAFFGGAAALGGGAGGAAGGGGTAMGGSAGTLGAADSSLASSQLGLTATDVGGGSFVYNPAIDSQLASSQLGLTATDVGGSQPYVFNSAADSQAANAALNLQPVTTDATIPSSTAPSTATGSSNYQMPQMGGHKQRPVIQPAPIAAEPSLDERMRALEVQDPNLVTSSRAKKTPVAVPLSAVARAGATGKDQVSQNGVHIGAIRALDKQIAQLEAAAHKKGIKV